MEEVSKINSVAEQLQTPKESNQIKRNMEKPVLFSVLRVNWYQILVI